MKHAHESLSRSIGLAIALVVVLVLGMAAVQYVGERIVSIAATLRSSAP